MSQPPKPKTKRTLSLAVLIPLLGITAVVVAAVMLQQTVPSQTFNGPVAVTSSTCNSATTPLTNTPNPATVAPGVITISCGTGAAFSVTTAGADTPTFPLPAISGASESLYIVTSTTACANTPPTGAQTLTTGTQLTLALGSYNYCWTYSSIPTGGATSTSFTISWSS